MIRQNRALPRVAFDTKLLLDFRMFDDPLSRPLRAMFDEDWILARMARGERKLGDGAPGLRHAFCSEAKRSSKL